MKKMTNDQLDKLKSLAERATPGPYNGFAGCIRTPKGLVGVNGPTCEDAEESATSKYIAAVSPGVVLGLIAEIGYLRDQLTRIREAEKIYYIFQESREKDIQSLLAENTELRKKLEDADYGEQALIIAKERDALRAENETLKTKAKVYLESVTELNDQCLGFIGSNEKLHAQLAEAREALEYYSDKNEWIDFKAMGWSENTVCQVNSHFDKSPWVKARTYLEKYPI